MIMIIISITFIICFFGYLFYKANESYIDQEIEKGTIKDWTTGRKIGYYIRYKRIYKNGKITYFEKSYK